MRLKNLNRIALKKISSGDWLPSYITLLIKYWLTLSEARYAFVNLYTRNIGSFVQGGGLPRNRRKKIAWRSAAKRQYVSYTTVGFAGESFAKISGALLTGSSGPSGRVGCVFWITAS